MAILQSKTQAKTPNLEGIPPMLQRKPNGVDVDALLAKIAELEGKLAKKSTLTLKVSEKGAVSLYGMGRFPVTLYGEQWGRLLALRTKSKPSSRPTKANSARSERQKRHSEIGASDRPFFFRDFNSAERRARPFGNRTITEHNHESGNLRSGLNPRARHREPINSASGMGQGS